MAYPQKKTMLANAENHERDVSKEPVMGSEMMSVYESRFGINSVFFRSITGPRGSMANPKKPQPAKKKESTLRGMINSAIYQIDQTVYGDDMAGTVDSSEKWRIELVVMKQGPELAMAESQKVARDNSLRGTRLVSRKKGPKSGIRMSGFTSPDADWDSERTPSVITIKSKFGTPNYDRNIPDDGNSPDDPF